MGFDRQFHDLSGAIAFRCRIFSVVAVDETFHIAHETVADFYTSSVKGFVQWVWFLEMFVNNIINKESLSDDSLDRLACCRGRGGGGGGGPGGVFGFFFFFFLGWVQNNGTVPKIQHAMGIY